MTDLIAKLRAALDEDERVARDALDEEARWEARNADGFSLEDPWVGYVDELGTVAAGMRADQALHIARHDPARVLRQVAAMRKVLEGVERYLDPHPGVPCTNIDEEGEPTHEPCDLHVAAKGRISPEVLPLLAEAYGIEP